MLSEEDPHEEAPHEENDNQTAKDWKTSSRAVSREGKDHIHVSSALLHAEQEDKVRRPRTAHATPDREETNFRHACIKRHSGCWPPFLKIAWTVQGARGRRQLPPPTLVDLSHYSMKTTSTEESSLQLSSLLGRVWQPLPQEDKGKEDLGAIKGGEATP
jgi:hypothetical protein